MTSSILQWEGEDEHHILIMQLLHICDAQRSSVTERDVMTWFTFNDTCVYVFVVLSVLQSQFIEKGLKKTGNVEHNMVLLFLFALDKHKAVNCFQILEQNNVFIATAEDSIFF